MEYLLEISRFKRECCGVDQFTTGFPKTEFQQSVSFEETQTWECIVPFILSSIKINFENEWMPEGWMDKSGWVSGWVGIQGEWMTKFYGLEIIEEMELPLQT